MPVVAKASSNQQPEVPSRFRRVELHGATGGSRGRISCAVLREPVEEHSAAELQGRDATPGVQSFPPSSRQARASRRPAKSLADGTWVKLICGASFEVHILGGYIFFGVHV